MRPLGRFAHPLFAAVLLASLAVAPAAAAEDPIITLDSRSEIEIDLKMIVNDFLPDLLEMARAEDPQKAELMEMMVELTGVRALDRLHMTSVTGKSEGVHRTSVTLDPDVEGGLLAAMVAVPDGTFRFGRYLRAEDAALLVSLANFSTGLEALYGMLTGPEMAAVLPPMLLQEDESGITIFGINFERDVFPLLEGELDLIVFPFQAGAAGPGARPPMAIVIGAADGPALRGRIFGMLGEKMGEETAAGFADAEGEAVGDFSFYPLPGGAAYAVSEDYLVVTSAPDRLRGMLAEPAGDLPEVKARQYVRMSTGFLLQVMGARMAEGGGGPEQEMFAELFATADEDMAGTMVLTTNAGPHRLDAELHQPGNLWSMEYRLLKTMFSLAPRLAAVRSDRETYTAAVARLDQAFIAYAADHEGLYPEAPQELVEEGYLMEFPELSPTPLGVYAEGAYTYLPLRDANGRVAGYYFLVYGLGEGTGFDILTEENTADPASFRPASDGAPDGVVSFCYDGLAVDQVEAWRDEN